MQYNTINSLKCASRMVNHLVCSKNLNIIQQFYKLETDITRVCTKSAKLPLSPQNNGWMEKDCGLIGEKKIMGRCFIDSSINDLQTD